MEDLSESHWNDVVTTSTISNYNDILHENGFQSSDNEEDDSLQQDSNQNVLLLLPYPVADNEQDDDEEQILEENKHILSSLIGGDDSNNTSSSILESKNQDTALSRDENLFNNIDVGPIDVEEGHNSPVSPVRRRTTKIMYKPPRFRRSAPKSSPTPVSSSNNDDDDSKDHDRLEPDLGPLKLVDDDDSLLLLLLQQEPNSPMRRDKLINSIDKPLFDINSPKKSKYDNVQQLRQKQQQEDSLISEIEKPEFQFDIVVGDPHKIGSELINAHIQYSVITKSNFPVLSTAGEIVVERRYNDFLWLYNQLVHNHPGLIIPPPPEKQVVGRFNKNFIENRRLSLEKMLLNIAQNLLLQKDQDFIIFLSSENFVAESKYREHNFEVEEDSSLISSITGAFSSLPKYVEQDVYFVDQQQYIENLDMNLKNLYKSLELMITTRNDLIISVEEFNKYLKKIAELEINNELSLIFNNYNELVSKILDNIERFSMSEMLTVGNVIDEYIRLVQSIKIIFNQRSKFIANLTNNELLLNKKQKNLSKFKLKFHNQLDKVKKYESEIEDLEKLIKAETVKKDELVSRIKSELTRFDNARLNDFKNSFEIYWESLIESQKELIELWETFYDNCKF